MKGKRRKLFTVAAKTLLHLGFPFSFPWRCSSTTGAGVSRTHRFEDAKNVRRGKGEEEGLKGNQTEILFESVAGSSGCLPCYNPLLPLQKDTLRQFRWLQQSQLLVDNNNEGKKELRWKSIRQNKALRRSLGQPHGLEHGTPRRGGQFESYMGQ